MAHEQLRHQRQRRDDPDPLFLQPGCDAAQRGVVSEGPQPGQDLETEPVGAHVEEPGPAQAAAEHGLDNSRVAQHLGDAAELADLDPRRRAQRRIGLAFVRHGDHGASSAFRRVGEQQRQAPRPGDEADGRSRHRAMPRSVPSRKETK